jgi:hypothetical protein
MGRRKAVRLDRDLGGVSLGGRRRLFIASVYVIGRTNAQRVCRPHVPERGGRGESGHEADRGLWASAH